jgi:hypothetical protein
MIAFYILEFRICLEFKYYYLVIKVVAPVTLLSNKVALKNKE